MSGAASGGSYEGRCHCGAIGFTYVTAKAPALWPVRECQCSFCRAHGARTTADPQGSVAFRVTDAAKLTRYRFGTGKSDFLVCAACGVYLAAVITTNRGQFATLNVNTVAGLPDLRNAQAVSYDGESSEQRIARREERWTPVSATVVEEGPT